MKFFEFKAARILVAVLAFGMLASVSAFAETSFVGKFTITEELRWDRAVLPAGEYSLQLESMQTPMRLIVRNMEGTKVAILTSQSINQIEGGRSLLLVTGVGANRQVRYVNLPALGLSLVYQPLSKSERQQLKEAELASVSIGLATD